MSATGTLVSLVTVIGIFAILALALNLKFGYTGILDFGHVAFFLVGAYVTALFVVPSPDTQPFQEFILGLDLQVWFIETVEAVTGVYTPLAGGLGWFVAGTIAISAAAFLGLVVALPAIRLREDYLAIALLGVSVIVQRIVQTETFIANGPDSLRGYPLPFNELTPLPGETLSAAVLLGAVVFVVWAILLYFAAKAIRLEAAGSRGGRVVRWLLVITTLGGGYWAIQRARSMREENAGDVGPAVHPGLYRHGLAVSLLFGVVATVLSLVGLGSEAILLFLGSVSLATWIVAWMKIREHYLEYGRREAAAGLVLALGLMVVLAPVYFLGRGVDLISYGSAIVTFVLLGGYLWGLYRFRTELDRFSLKGDYLGLVGIGLVWLLAIRYFVISLGGSTSIQANVQSTIENLFWLVSFDDGLAASLGYRRFLMIIVVATLVVSYIVMQVLVNSPYGRVLKAIRDDENVALSLGKNTFLFKVQSMLIGGAVAGLAGVLGAIYYRALSYTLFHPLVTFFVFLMVILGGKANNKGVILGAGLYWLFVRATVELSGIFPGVIGNRITILRNAIIGLLLVLLLFYQPRGLWKEERFVAEVPD